MILTAYQNDSRLVEIVDISSSLTTCENLPDYPITTRGTVGGLLDNKVPIVCGGLNVKDCYQYQQGQWQLSFPMNENRYHSAGMVSSPYQNVSHKLFVVGGGNPPLIAAEVLTATGWEVIGSPLPKQFFVSCLVSINETTIMLIGGTIENITYSKDTYIFNALTNIWVKGPSMELGRRGAGCGKISENGQSNRQIIIVAGGENARTSVEFLDDIDGSWRSGTF
jgi:hypothetical protein